jgi:hypothetical protein
LSGVKTVRHESCGEGERAGKSAGASREGDENTAPSPTRRASGAGDAGN